MIPEPSDFASTVKLMVCGASDGVVALIRIFTGGSKGPRVSPLWMRYLESSLMKKSVSVPER